MEKNKFLHAHTQYRTPEVPPARLPGHSPYIVQWEYIKDVVIKWESPATRLCEEVYAILTELMKKPAHQHFATFGQGILEHQIREAGDYKDKFLRYHRQVHQDSRIKDEELAKLFAKDEMEPALEIIATVRGHVRKHAFGEGRNGIDRSLVVYKRFIDNVPMEIEPGLLNVNVQ
ncbi:hypothetical protein P691DRAFT_765150 [Macrolepiota fuliginosa MF-IS2]|uniref:Uncharacterized protein n=1 Tax=Macrolepiota fuliginosa MF-IS2 TaxID=1400762 RepID=A0A9P5X2Q2_9AGAR|nr:hypothetical protein P691DRAFT_765150 [Macrolepiota fuliginosa MF-IS2]